MSSVSLPLGRVSFQQSSSLLLGTLQSEQSSLLQVQQQISSGNRLNLASDDPVAAVGIQSLNRQIADNTQYSSNLNFAKGFLDTATNGLSDLRTLLSSATSLANSQVGALSTPDERAANAQVIDSYISQALDIGNTQYLGQSVFGSSGTQNAFIGANGGYQFVGSTLPQGILTPSGSQIQYTVNGNDVFGGTSSQVVGYQDLTPALTGSTRLADLAGAQGKGISAGSVNVSVGGTTVTADLSKAATVNDVVNILNSALISTGSSATISINGGSLEINGDSTQTVAIADPQSGSTAASLGIATSVSALGAAVGIPLSPKITATTPLSALNGGTGIDPSGIVINNGTATATITLAGLHTVGDLVNAINNSGTHVQASINSAGNGINLFNPVSGSALTVGENGGNTADQLGIRSFNPTTKLSDLNAGAGVTPISKSIGGPTGQFIVTKTDGTTFNVQADGIKTTAQLIAAINSATGNGSVIASANANGNGITLTDSSGGPGNLSVTAAPGYISNGTQLGILTASGGTVTGTGGTLTGPDIAFSTDDFRITKKDGSSFSVNITGASTIQDVLNLINNADGNTNPATQVTASLNTTGNGIELTDASTGSGALTVTSLNDSSAASQLGILQTAAAATSGTINGTDVNPLQPQGIFSSLVMLRNALLNNDDAGIQQAANLLTQDATRVIKANGVTSARDQDVVTRIGEATDQSTQLASSLSLLAGTDVTSAITKYQSLQTAYEAALKVSQTTSNLSLLDFLK